MQKVSSQKNWLLILCSLLIFSLVASLIPGIVLADEEKAPFDSPYFEVIVDDEGRELIRAIFPLPPPETKVEAASVPDVHIAGANNSLLSVPAFDWSYGCSATAAAMLFGYYDRTGYSNMYNGPTNGGVCPVDNSGWGIRECPLSATHDGIDDRAIRGHVDDYWIDVNQPGPDPYVTYEWTEHTLGDCTGDYMGTNQAKYSNTDGSTTFYWYTNGDPLSDYIDAEPASRDGCHGMWLFADSRGYTVVENFTQLIDEQVTEPGKGFTFADFQAEIDAGRPVLIQVTGHSMLGYGYNTTGNIIYVHDTWDYDDHEMTWGGTYGISNLQHWAVTVIRLATLPTFSDAIHIRAQDYSAAVSTITFPVGEAGATVSNPSNSQGETQIFGNAGVAKPVVTLVNTGTVGYNIWYNITTFTNDVVSNEYYLINDKGAACTSADAINNAVNFDSDQATSTTIGASSEGDAAMKDLYLEVALGSTPGLSGGSTLTILGESP